MLVAVVAVASPSAKSPDKPALACAGVSGGMISRHGSFDWVDDGLCPLAAGPGAALWGWRGGRGARARRGYVGQALSKAAVAGVPSVVVAAGMVCRARRGGQDRHRACRLAVPLMFGRGCHSETHACVLHGTAARVRAREDAPQVWEWTHHERAQQATRAKHCAGPAPPRRLTVGRSWAVVALQADGMGDVRSACTTQLQAAADNWQGKVEPS